MSTMFSEIYLVFSCLSHSLLRSSGEPVEAAVSPPHQGSAAPVKANGSAAAVSAEQAVNTSFMSPGRRPSAFAAFNSPSKRSQMPPLLLSAFARYACFLSFVVLAC